MVMGRNGHGPKWLWAEMTRNRKNGLVAHYRATGHFDPGSFLLWVVSADFGGSFRPDFSIPHG